jgi:hypothetical protein
MSATTILLRFIFGVVLAGGLALWGGVPPPWGPALAAVAGVAAAVWGDKFLMGLMSLMRYLR